MRKSNKAVVKFYDGLWAVFVGSEWMASWENSREGYEAAECYANSWNRRRK